MGFDSEGNLYVTTGDTNSSQGSDGGYSGNNPVAKCPTGPADRADERALRRRELLLPGRAPNRGQHQRLQRQDAAVQPDGGHPGGHRSRASAATYTLPTATSPNGPNLFDGTEGGGGKAKPEIYAMGLRNPSRLSIDPETGHAVHGVGRPGRRRTRARPGARRPTRTPRRSRAPATTAGRTAWAPSRPTATGWPTAPRARTARAGYVPGGPATGGTDGWYDCDNLRNDSPNNTGLVEFPHVTGTGADAGKVRGNNLWYSRGNPSNANGCPEFPRPRGATAAPNYGATPRRRAARTPATTA